MLKGRRECLLALASTWIALATLWTGGCGRASTTTGLAPLSASVGTAALAAPKATTSSPPATDGPDDLSALVHVFPHSEVSDVVGPESLRRRVGEVLDAIARQDNGARSEVSFVVDRTLPENVAFALELALAANRTKLVRGGRFALVSSGNRSGAWETRVEAPLGEDPYAVLRAAGQMEWTPDGSGGGVGASWAGLVEATRLDWRARADRRHIVLLTDDRSRPELLRMAPLPPVDPSTRATVTEWARAADATLHIARCMLDLADGRGTGPDARPDPGLPLELVAGLFRDGHYTRTDSPAALVAAVENALARAAPASAPADVTLAVDLTGMMGETLSTLAKVRPALEHFVAAPGHRLALIRWGRGAPVVAVPLTRTKSAVPAALAALRAGPPGDWPKDLFAALDAARGLAGSPAARKTVIVLTAAPSGSSAAGPVTIGWIDSAAVAVSLVEPAPGATALGRAP